MCKNEYADPKVGFDRQGPVVVSHFAMPRPVYVPWHPCTSQYFRLYCPEQDNLRILKNIASFFGDTPDDIKALLAAGYTTDEIEEELYCFTDGKSPGKRAKKFRYNTTSKNQGRL